VAILNFEVSSAKNKLKCAKSRMALCRGRSRVKLRMWCIDESSRVRLRMWYFDLIFGV
jgi:hypothetical protein